MPEGGSNALGALGYVHAAAEIAEQCAGALPSAVVVATGSGGTVAGLALGFRALDLPVRTVGIAVCDDRPTFLGIAAQIAADAQQHFGLAPPRAEDLDIIEGFQGRGYALSTSDELALLRDTARLDGLVLDPVYTLKAFRAVVELAPTGALGPRVLFVHTRPLQPLRRRQWPRSSDHSPREPREPVDPQHLPRQLRARHLLARLLVLPRPLRGRAAIRPSSFFLSDAGRALALTFFAFPSFSPLLRGPRHRQVQRGSKFAFSIFAIGPVEEMAKFTLS
ncbi:MAG: pyridoxal-phosphate dependent enzyme [Myxococcota bacterium]